MHLTQAAYYLPHPLLPVSNWQVVNWQGVDFVDVFGFLFFSSQAGKTQSSFVVNKSIYLEL
jgi:hypothetical protein